VVAVVDGLELDQVALEGADPAVEQTSGHGSLHVFDIAGAERRGGGRFERSASSRARALAEHSRPVTDRRPTTSCGSSGFDAAGGSISGFAELGDALFTARPLYERALGMLSIRTWSWST
jgi:hypothetical protein